MCLKPIKIGNPTRRFVPGLSRPVFYVPCGSCKECMTKQQDDWFVRAIFEAKRVRAKGGAVWFPTLTYNDENLPVWNDPIHDYSCQCFSKEHFKSFRNKLRIYLKRKGYDCSGENTIRYIYCCEYGSEKGRAHIHCLLFVPFFVPKDVMQDCIDRAWIYGFAMESKKGLIVEGIAGIQYAMKYITKDMLWMKKYDVEDYLATLKNDIHTASSPELAEKARELLRQFRRVMPHHGQSMGFGVDGVNYFRNADGSWNKDLCVDGRIDRCKLGLPPTKRGQNFMYNMPMYFVRKIFYNVDDWNLYKLSEFGKEIFAIRYDLSLRREAEKYLPYLQSFEAMRQHLAPLKYEQDKMLDFHRNIEYTMKGRNAFDLALFNKVYRDIERNEENECIFTSIEGLDTRNALDFLKDISLDFMLAQKSVDRIPDPEGVKIYFNHIVKDNTFNNCFAFDGFLQVLEAIETLEAELGKLEQEAYVLKREREANTFGKDNYNYINRLKFSML